MILPQLFPLNPPHGKAATPIAFIKAILLAYEKYGEDPSGALAYAQISPAELADPNARVTANQMEIISGYAMQELDDEALGWFSRRLPWGSYGMLCRASLTSPNLGIALKRWCRHHRLLTDDVTLELTRIQDLAIFSVTPHLDLGKFREFCLISCLRYMLGYASWAIDSRISITRVDFPYPAPPHRHVYPLLFQEPVHFSMDGTRLVFDARYLELPIRRDERALQNMLQRALPLTVRQYRRDRLLVQSVRQLLQEQPEQASTAEHVARRLHLSVRTLHRQLQEEGASLQQLKDEIRRERAIELLHRTRQPIKQIAAQVGFQSEKSFVRAFKAWTGSSPGTFREGTQHESFEPD
ncbi:MAG: AraC family transcriptional regulator [Rhodocyclaceae bacterium]|jgi:AraC-like DNA-binding protein|nr:AraC family transcriptional regulator [Rhodocyclaceae bacterium]